MSQTNLIVLIGGVAVAAAVATSLFTDQNGVPETAPQIVQQTEPKIEKTVQPKATIQPKVIEPSVTIQPASLPKQEKVAGNKAFPPSFDVVRISPMGNAVIAGRAPAGSTVSIINNEKRIGTAVADRRGEWVYVPDIAFKPGTTQLTLTMRIGDGPIILSDNDVMLVVPEQKKDIAGQLTEKPSGALVMQLPRKKTGKNIGRVTLLQHPTDEPSEKLSVELLDYDENGRLTVSGHAPPQSKVNLYLDNLFIGQTKSDEKSSWHILPNRQIEPGIYKLRADQVDEKGKVAARVSMPFSRAEPDRELPAEPFVIVQPGNSLWRIAHGSYGTGLSYTIIFMANMDQIKDPDLIYPGQILTVPPTN